MNGLSPVNVFTEYHEEKKDSELKKHKMLKPKWKCYFNLFPYIWCACSLNAKKINFKSLMRIYRL